MATIALVGGQYGSEGKGVIAAFLAPQTVMAIRTGGPNAGHSLKHEGQVWKMRSIPCAWINPETTLVIGAGAVINPHVLLAEIAAIEQAGYSIKDRLYVDRAATLITEIDEYAEEDIARQISSTREGVGQARIRKIQ